MYKKQRFGSYKIRLTFLLYHLLAKSVNLPYKLYIGHAKNDKMPLNALGKICCITKCSTKLKGIPKFAIINFYILLINNCKLSLIIIAFTNIVATGFPGSSDGKESSCNTGDSGSILGLRRSAGEGIGYPLQYSWASLVVQKIKNLPTIQETWV